MVRAVAAVSNVGTENAAVFNFTIPRGEKGDKGSDGANPFYITCTESGNTITADKTWAEIKAAYSAGQVIAVKVGTGVLPLMSADVTGDTLKITDAENAQRYKIYANGELKGRVDRNG